MSRNGNFNMEDPVEQEKIRRSTHEYVPTEGKHGAYRLVKGGYRHQEYPKMMLTMASPNRKDFGRGLEAEINFESAIKEWNEALKASIVRNKAEEEDWKEAASANEARAKKEATKIAEREKIAKLEARAALLKEFREAAEAAKELEKLAKGQI